MSNEEEKVNQKKTELIVALDFPRAERALHLVEELDGLPVIYKVGSELFLSGGPDLVRELVHKKHRVFLDLKFHDIPNTAAKAACQAALLQVEMFTLHLAGGVNMVKAVMEEMALIPELRPKVLGVTVLTSFDDVSWGGVTRALTEHAVDVDLSVQGLIGEGALWGVDGVVCSAQELPQIKDQYPSLYTVVPGIRLQGDQAQDQARIMTPAQARQFGADAVVMGRPIVRAEDSRKMAENVLKDLSRQELSA